MCFKACTVVRVSSSEEKAGPLPETELRFWLGVMAAFDNAEDSEHYDVCCEWGLCYSTALGVAASAVVVSMQFLFRECRCNPLSITYPMPRLGLAIGAWLVPS